MDIVHFLVVVMSSDRRIEPMPVTLMVLNIHQLV